MQGRLKRELIVRLIALPGLLAVMVGFQNCTPQALVPQDSTLVSTFSEKSMGIVPGWPDAIKCATGDGKYMVLRQWLSGASGNVAYGTPQNYVRFNTDGVIDSVVGNYAALSTSNCQVGNFIDSIEATNFTRSTEPLLGSLPDAVLCEGSTGRIILHKWLKGVHGNTGYGTPDNMINVNAAGEITDVLGVSYSAMTNSNCQVGNSLDGIRTFSFASTNRSIVGGIPDSIVCASPDGRYNILFNWIKASAGEIAYGFPGTEVAYSPATMRVSRARSSTTALAESDCRIGRDFTSLSALSIAD